MKKRRCFISGIALYFISFILIIDYFMLNFCDSVSLSPSLRVTALLFICLLMHLGAFFIIRSSFFGFKDKLLRFNLSIWFILYIHLLSTLTLFDERFFRNNYNLFNIDTETFFEYITHSFNLIPFHTVIPMILKFINGEMSFYIFLYNIFGNIAAFMPFAFFLPLLFEKQNNFKVFIFTMILIVSGIELLQLMTMSGFCDIDDVLLNVSGAGILHWMLHIPAINQPMRAHFL